MMKLINIAGSQLWLLLLLRCSLALAFSQALPGRSSSTFRFAAKPFTDADFIDLEFDEEQEDFDYLADYEDCIPPGRRKQVLIISDTTGLLANTAVQKMLAQFGSFDDVFYTCGEGVISSVNEDCIRDCDDLIQKRTFTFIRSEEAVAAIVKTAQERKAMIVHTLADPHLRESTNRMCQLSNVTSIDLVGPLFEQMADFFQRRPAGIPGIQPRRSALSDGYFRRVEAVEYTLKADDGQSPWLLPHADVILVGVSRTGKTPLSVVLSHTMGLRVANVPLVLEIPPPTQLLEEVDSRRVFCLTAAPNQLKIIREARLYQRLVQATNDAHNYADRNYLLRDLMNARRLAETHQWTEIDVTGRAVEETASYIVQLLTERFPDETIDAEY